MRDATVPPITWLLAVSATSSDATWDQQAFRVRNRAEMIEAARQAWEADRAELARLRERVAVLEVVR
jgi:hypothetical protein